MSRTRSQSDSKFTWYQSLACCCLVSTSSAAIVRQCVIVDLGNKELSPTHGFSSGSRRNLALVTNHSVVPSLSHVKEWKLQGLRPTRIRLTENNFSRCLSCCGPNGVWCKEMHQPQSHDPSTGKCPINEDWTLLILKQEFVSKHAGLLFPPLVTLDQKNVGEALRSKRFYVYQRNARGIVDRNKIDVDPTLQETRNLEDEIDFYRGSCSFQLSSDCREQIEDSGSPIFYHTSDYPPDDPFHGFRLYGIRCPNFECGIPKASTSSSSPNHSFDTEMTRQYGTALHHIINISSAMGETQCKLIPSLAFLKVAVQHNRCMVESIRRLSSCLSKGNLELSQLLGLLEFLLREAPPLMGDSSEHKELTVAQAELLRDILSHCENSSPNEIKEAVEAMPHESGSECLPFFSLVEALCGQLLRLMNRCAEGDGSEDTVIIRAGFKLWEALMHFSYENGPAFVLTSHESFTIAQKFSSKDLSMQQSLSTISAHCYERMRSRTEKLEQQTKAMETQLEALEQQHLRESENQQQKISELENEKECYVQIAKKTSEDLQKAKLSTQRLEQEGEQSAIVVKKKVLTLEQQILENEEQLSTARREKEKEVRLLRTQLSSENEKLEQQLEIMTIEKGQFAQKCDKLSTMLANCERDLAKRDEQLVEEKEARKKLNQQYKKEKQSHQHKVRELEQQLGTAAKEKRDELSTALDKCEQELVRKDESVKSLQNEYEKKLKGAQEEVSALQQEAEQKASDAHPEKEHLLNAVQREKEELLAHHRRELAKINEENATLTALKDEQIRVLTERLQQLKHSCDMQSAKLERLDEEAAATGSHRRTLSIPSPGASPYIPRRKPPSLLQPLQTSFWESDIAKILERDMLLRVEIAKYFHKTPGATGGTWEHLLHFLIQEVNVQMEADPLDSSEDGDILLSIVKCWSKKERVTADRFCRVVSGNMGITRVKEILENAKKEFDKPL